MGEPNICLGSGSNGRLGAVVICGCAGGGDGEGWACVISDAFSAGTAEAAGDDGVATVVGRAAGVQDCHIMCSCGRV